MCYLLSLGLHLSDRFFIWIKWLDYGIPPDNRDPLLWLLCCVSFIVCALDWSASRLVGVLALPGCRTTLALSVSETVSFSARSVSKYALIGAWAFWLACELPSATAGYPCAGKSRFLFVWKDWLILWSCSFLSLVFESVDAAYTWFMRHKRLFVPFPAVGPSGFWDARVLPRWSFNILLISFLVMLRLSFFVGCFLVSYCRGFLLCLVSFFSFGFYSGC